jgi:hypothetical protein
MLPHSENNRTKVVYVGGSGRCGSTLLSLLFSQHQSFFDCGEIRNIWDRGILENRKCACGEPFSNCQFWSAVVQSAFGIMDPATITRMSTVAGQVTRYRNYFKLRNASRSGHGFVPEDYREALDRLYKAISNSAQGKIIIDSSKSAAYARLLMMLPDVDIFYVNLIRNPCAVVYSWQKKMAYEPGAAREMDRFGVVRASLIWKFAYMTANDVMREVPGITIRYEDLVNDTSGTMGAILSGINTWLEGPLPDMNIEKLSWANVSHSLSGNPLRFRKGEAIKLDEKWKTEFKGIGAVATSILCNSEIRRYRYAR